MSYNWYKTSKIKKEKNKWKVTDESGQKNLGEYDSKKDAVERLKQVEYFKHNSSSNYLKILESLDVLDSLFLKNNTNFIKKLASTLTIENSDHIKIKNFKIKSIASLSTLFSSNNLKASEYWINNNKEKINEILSAWGQLGFECYANREDVNIDKYDLIIFDADNTIWEGTCARDMTPPFYKLDENTAKDSKGNICQLINGVRETLLKLRAKGKDVGMISHSENESESHEKQPVILLLRTFGIFELFNDIIVITKDLPKDIFIPKNRNVLFVDDKDNNLSDVIKNTNADVIKAGEEINFEASVDNNIKKAISNNWYKTSRSYIPISERPKKPKKDGKDYELDHIRSKWKGGKDKKNNLQWIEKENHKKKSQEEGSFQKGGKDRHRKLKDKGEKNYSKYQSDCGKAKIEKEKEELGNKGFSQKQRERALKRWNKAFSSNKIFKESTISTYRNELIDDEYFVHAMEIMQKCNTLIDFANAEREYENRTMELTGNKEITKKIMISLIKSFSKELFKHSNEGTCLSIRSLIKTYF